MYAGGKINPMPGIIYNTTIDGTRECGSDFSGRINLFPLQLQHIKKFLVPYDQIRPVSKSFVRALMAHLKASQFDAGAVEPNTIAVARLHNSSNMKTNAPDKSAWILVYQKHALTSARPRRIVAVE
jgi:hypothetical protein